MTVELFEGNVTQLKARLDAINAANTINQLIPTHQKGKYIILWT